MSALLKSAVVVALFAPLTAAGALALAPRVATALCPRCFGYERVDAALYVDRDATPADRESARAAASEGRARAARFFGAMRSNPDVIVCASRACAPTQPAPLGEAYGAQALLLWPNGVNAVIAAHELAHIETHERVGTWRFLSGTISAWFDEGLAVLVSDDPRYLRREGERDRCFPDDGRPLPATASEWRRAAGERPKLYAQAACRVWRWGAAHGAGAARERAALLTLLDRLAAGEAFDVAWSKP